MLSWIVAVALAGVAAATASAQFTPPPPQGDLDLDICRERASPAPENGRLIGLERRRPGLSGMRPDGSGLRRITTPPRGYTDYYPAASPDGRSVAFLRVWTPNADGRSAS